LYKRADPHADIRPSLSSCTPPEYAASYVTQFTTNSALIFYPITSRMTPGQAYYGSKASTLLPLYSTPGCICISSLLERGNSSFRPRISHSNLQAPSSRAMVSFMFFPVSQMLRRSDSVRDGVRKGLGRSSSISFATSLSVCPQC
jgi:hypothetical protein